MSKSNTNSNLRIANEQNVHSKLVEQGAELWGWLLCAAIGVALAGCQNDAGRLRGDGFTKDATWGEEFRDSDSSGEQFGFTNKARQIENSLGVK